MEQARPATPKFCRRCGAAWQSEWTECAACAEGERGRADPPPRGPVAAPLALYFTILITHLGGWLAVWTGADEAAAVLWCGAIDSAIVLGLCVSAHRLILPLLRTFPVPRWWAAAAGLAIVTYAVASLALALVGSLFAVPLLEPAEELWDAGYGWSIVILVYCVQPAVIEELAFRGFILGALRRLLTGREAVFVSALLFMVIHLAVPSFLHLFLMGLVLGYLRIRTGSLYPCIVLHFTHNLLCVLFDPWLS
jgi:CAAX protease family protein